MKDERLRKNSAYPFLPATIGRHSPIYNVFGPNMRPYVRYVTRPRIAVVFSTYCALWTYPRIRRYVPETFQPVPVNINASTLPSSRYLQDTWPNLIILRLEYWSIAPRERPRSLSTSATFEAVLAWSFGGAKDKIIFYFTTIFFLFINLQFKNRCLKEWYAKKSLQLM